jgi:hypothetical protein
MSNLYEKAIKIAYENRANAMIAAKKAADKGYLDQAVQAFKGFMEKHPNIRKGATAGVWGGAAMAPVYGITRALGGTPGQAWRNAGIAGGGVAAAKATYDYRNEIKGGLGKAGQAIKGLFDKVKSKPAASQGQNNPSTPAPKNAPAGQKGSEQPRENKTLTYLQKQNDSMQNIINKGVNSVNQDAAAIDKTIAMLQTNPTANAQLISELQARKDNLLGKGPKAAESRLLTDQEKSIRDLKTQRDMLQTGNDPTMHSQAISELNAKIDAAQGKKTGQYTSDTSPRMGSRNTFKNWGKASEELTGQDLADFLTEHSSDFLNSKGSPGKVRLMELTNKAHSPQGLTPQEEVEANKYLYTEGYVNR